MAVSKATKQKPRKSKKGKKNSGVGGLIVPMLLGMLLLIYFFSFAALLILLGMLPSFVAIYVDRSLGRGNAKVVAACNFAGVVPFIVKLMGRGITSETVHSTMLQPTTWMVMFAAAGFGWALVWGLPRLAHIALAQIQQNTIAGLQKRQRQIIDEWGPDVESMSSRALRNSGRKDDAKVAEPEVAAGRVPHKQLKRA